MEALLEGNTLTVVLFVVSSVVSGLTGFLGKYFVDKKKLENDKDNTNTEQTWLIYQDLVKTFKKNWENAVEAIKIIQVDYIIVREKYAETKAQLAHQIAELKERDEEIKNLKKYLDESKQVLRKYSKDESELENLKGV